ncbi:cytochrome c oxidase subunit 4 isoform 2, mitochondrial-like [Uloborus diversus]|uniref:cytochrome c oxidase subunit 4 isoform 2, mitochondrial-like n=1 Tax=Uloborus diversus TaxID=327109 RepID=UPI002409AFA1|nr:cytochrome c oxidase subunit 4 isoform 2, mitochondrial-like [Uloborus diversus]XP_054713906.1 cytochrome c oxidase subunit 4 isoform 2, mitochondrial-like [Uloborus diversus]
MAFLMRTVSHKQILKLMSSPLMLKHLAAIHGRARIGNRDVVGFGVNGEYSYIDRVDYPMPAIRFRENTSESKSLREKEKGDWKKLTLDEKKALYRHSFCATFAEQRAPTGDWKYIIGGVCIFMSLTLWSYYFIRLYVYPPPPYSMTPEHQAKMLETMIQLRVDPIDGLTSTYDYENNRWKN